MDVPFEVIGVYRLDVTPDVFQAQLPMYGDEAECWNHFSSVVLVEALADAEDGAVDLAAITQANPAFPGGFPQVPWDEGLLSTNGETLICRKLNCVTGSGRLRFAVYMHFWNPSLPLIWKRGEVLCPHPAQMPNRMKRLMPYRPCD